MITIVDYGMGNLGSLRNMFQRIEVPVLITSDPETIKGAEKLILPGVGAFDSAMQRINDVPQLRQALDYKALQERIPVLGVCLGMQLMTLGSEEGSLPGLGWIPAETKRFPKSDELKVPHMGWNLATPHGLSAITQGIEDEPRYYFVHSYFVQTHHPDHSIMKTRYGIEFDSAIGNGHLYGVQFHPEKSHRFGMRILKNFAEL